MMYFVAFLAALGVDLIPIFAPPAWTLLLLIILRYHLKPWPTLVLGAAGSTIGRYVLSMYIAPIARKILNQEENENVRYLGTKIGDNSRASVLFVLAYSLTPLSTTALFTAVGIAGANPLNILPAFFVGTVISNAATLFTAFYEVDSLRDLMHGQLNWRTGFAAFLAWVLIAAVLFIDWKTLLEHRKLSLRFHIFA